MFVNEIRAVFFNKFVKWIGDCANPVSDCINEVGDCAKIRLSGGRSIG